MKIKVTMEIEVPRVPNFLRRSDGVMMPINLISHESLRELGQQWTDDLINRAIELEKAVP